MGQISPALRVILCALFLLTSCSTSKQPAGDPPKQEVLVEKPKQPGILQPESGPGASGTEALDYLLGGRKGEDEPHHPAHGPLSNPKQNPNPKPVERPVVEEEPFAEIGPIVESPDPDPIPVDDKKPVEPGTQDFLEGLIQEFSGQVKKDPSNQTLKDKLVILYLIQGKPEEAYKLAGKDSVDTLSSSRNLALAMTYMEIGEVEKAMKILDEWTEKLREKLPLSMLEAKLVEENSIRAEILGCYEELDGGPLPAGKLLGLYVELENYAWRKDIKGRFSYSLDFQLEVFRVDEKSDSVTKIDWDPFQGANTTWMQDKRHALPRIACPAARFYAPVESGTYEMKVTIVDNFSARKSKASKRLRFSVLGRK